MLTTIHIMDGRLMNRPVTHNNFIFSRCNIIRRRQLHSPALLITIVNINRSQNTLSAHLKYLL